jgi:hypothetical protein
MIPNFLNCNLSETWFLENVSPVVKHLQSENIKACGVNRVADYHNAQLARVRSAYAKCKGSDTDEVKENVVKLFDEMEKLKRGTKKCKGGNTSAGVVSKRKTRSNKLKHRPKTKRHTRTNAAKHHKRKTRRKSATSKRR